MTLKNMIELADGLTPIETEIGYYILKNQEDILDMSVIELAEKTFVELININPRMMFDVFDENEIFIRIIPDNHFFFSCVDDEKPTRHKTRKEAELSGIIEATKILNNKLEQLEKDKILTDEIL